MNNQQPLLELAHLLKASINFLGVFGAWFLISRGVGGRTLYLYGLCGLFCMLIILGFLGLAPNEDAASLATGVVMLLWSCCYQLTVGTFCYSLVGEMSKWRLQIKTVALGRAAYFVVAIICNVVTPYMLNLTECEWSHVGEMGFVCRVLTQGLSRGLGQFCRLLLVNRYLPGNDTTSKLSANNRVGATSLSFIYTYFRMPEVSPTRV